MMQQIIQLWWAWAAFALVLITVETLIPGYIFLGFAFGAACIAIALGLGFTLSTPVILVLLTSLSLLAWLLLRRFFKPSESGKKVFTNDIND